MHTIHLSRRNLLSLLNKLDRNALNGTDVSQCTIIKPNEEGRYPTTGMTMVVAVEDDEYYGALGREAGPMHSADEPKGK